MAPLALDGVPNAPCGVERMDHPCLYASKIKFLMHRVELKVKKDEIQTLRILVPNAPCGVERQCSSKVASSFKGFLMHRVELKAFGNRI